MHAEEGEGEEKKKEKMFHGNGCLVYVSHWFIQVCLDGAVMWCVMFVGLGDWIFNGGWVCKYRNKFRYLVCGGVNAWKHV